MPSEAEFMRLARLECIFGATVKCNNRDCPRTIFLLQYQDKGRLPAVKQQIVDMTLNGSGVRDIVRVLKVSSATVIDVLKKKEPAVKQVNERLLHTLDSPQVDVILRQVDAAEMDEMWSFVGSKSQQRWLWHAIDHHTGLMHQRLQEEHTMEI